MPSIRKAAVGVIAVGPSATSLEVGPVPTIDDGRSALRRAAEETSVVERVGGAKAAPGQRPGSADEAARRSFEFTVRTGPRAFTGTHC